MKSLKNLNDSEFMSRIENNRENIGVHTACEGLRRGLLKRTYGASGRYRVWRGGERRPYHLDSTTKIVRVTWDGRKVEVI